jgi:hypothetical protein
MHILRFAALIALAHAAEIASKALPDGRTLMFGAIGHAINPLLQNPPTIRTRPSPR